MPYYSKWSLFNPFSKAKRYSVQFCDWYSGWWENFWVREDALSFARYHQSGYVNVYLHDNWKRTKEKIHTIIPEGQVPVFDQWGQFLFFMDKE